VVFPSGGRRISDTDASADACPASRNSRHGDFNTCRCLEPAEAPPNRVISEDGSLVAIVHGAALASNRERPPDFIFDQWQRALVLPEHQPPRFIDAVDVPQP
jgi:hypothetical protein